MMMSTRSARLVIFGTTRGFAHAGARLTKPIKVPGPLPTDDEDNRWAEADRKLTPEERYARDKENAILEKMATHVEELKKHHATSPAKSPTKKGVQAQIDAIGQQLAALKAQLKD
eukprot:TRINITY_DN4227_c0_g1_i1.p1 TRINITY_DN4227_c0_g1~~TRINITY_DN4227_c0_g1_i1.p1  ORF type:complete len:122 (-),score=46.00 TRINITY_DN4227_c0_g1_i1:130-474(-)